MAALTERAITRWRPGETLDASEEMMRLTLAIVGKTLFDADTEGDARVVGEALTDGMQYMVDSITSLPALLLPYSFPTPSNQKMRRAVTRLDEVIYRIIAERRASAELDRGDVLSVLIAARDEDDGTGMTDTQMRDEAMTLMLAGHETTANTLAWTFYLLGTHPEVQERVVEEVRRVCEGRTPGFDELARMPYVAQVIKESMRLYPPAYIVVREAQRSFEIGSHRVEKGELPFVNIFGIHRRADYYPEPEAFKPERFEPAREKSLPRGAFIPFGAGPRVCIGNHFAAMEAQVVLATIVQRVKLELLSAKEPVMEPMVTLRPRGGVAARVHTR
jgi:cytochrome P450